MYLIRSNSNDPKFNLATEEYLLKQKAEDCIMLWINSSCVVIGKNQNPYAEVNLRFANQNNIPVVRRITGGGTVYHDINNINFSFIQTKPDIEDLDFSLFTTPIIDLLNKKGLNAKASRNDILIDGYKISGNAQLICNHRILHHGTLLFETNMDILKKILTPNPIKLEKKFISSNKKATKNINSFFKTPLPTTIWFEELSNYFIDNFNATPYSLTNEDIINIRSLVKEKYDNKTWTFPMIDNYQFKKENYLESGLIQLFFSVKNLKISALKILGDFFSLTDIEYLENILIGTTFNYDSIYKKLIDNDSKKYINNVNIKELSSLFFS